MYSLDQLVYTVAGTVLAIACLAAISDALTWRDPYGGRLERCVKILLWATVVVSAVYVEDKLELSPDASIGDVLVVTAGLVVVVSVISGGFHAIISPHDCPEAQTERLSFLEPLAYVFIFALLLVGASDEAKADKYVLAIFTLVMFAIVDFTPDRSRWYVPKDESPPPHHALYWSPGLAFGPIHRSQRDLFKWGVMGRLPAALALYWFAMLAYPLLLALLLWSVLRHGKSAAELFANAPFLVRSALSTGTVLLAGALATL